MSFYKKYKLKIETIRKPHNVYECLIEVDKKVIILKVLQYLYKKNLIEKYDSSLVNQLGEL